MGLFGSAGSCSSTSTPAAAIQRSLNARISAGFVDDGAARGVDQDGLGLHQAQLALADEMVRFFQQRTVERDEVGTQTGRGPVDAGCTPCSAITSALTKGSFASTVIS